MAIIEIRKITDEPQEIGEYADFLIGLLLREGAGVIETEYKRRRNANENDSVTWVYRSRKTGEKKTIWTSFGLAFRPALANIGWRFLNNPYHGHINFRVHYQDETDVRKAGFGLFLCNESETGVWLKLYRRYSPLENEAG